MNKITLLLIGLGSIAGFIAHRAYQVSELTSGLFVLFIVSWFLFSMVGISSIWNLISLFKHPFMASLMIGGLAFTYWTFQGNLFGESSVFMTGFMLLGAAFGMWTFMYWNIGG